MSGLVSREHILKESADLFTDQRIVDARTKIVEWLNSAVMASSKEKCEALAKIQETILNTQVELIEEFAENIVSFSRDPSQDVRRSVVTFIEQICRVNIDYIPEVIDVLTTLLRDSSPQVTKRVIQACGSVYKNALKWICSKVEISDEVEQAWNKLSLIKAEILDMIDNDNDGIRTNAVKFLEGVVILQTYADEDSMKRSKDFSLEDVPVSLKIARRRKLEIEALNIFDCLLQFHAASHISSVNLIACTGTLCTIAKLRTSLMKPVVDALNSLLSNLPPTLTDSQVNSVKKHLKMQLLNLLKNRGSLDLQPTICLLLQDLGATHQEIVKAIPKVDKEEQRRIKRAHDSSNESSSSKKTKVDQTNLVDARQKEVDAETLLAQKANSNKLNEKFLLENLNRLDSVVHLVMVSIKNLPEEIPADFIQNYKPITDMTIPQQISKISAVLAVQMTDNKIGPGAVAFTKNQTDIELLVSNESMIVDLDDKSSDVSHREELVKSVGDIRKEEAARKLRDSMEKVKGEQALLQRMKQRVKTLKLQEITKPLTKQAKEQYMLNAIGRILKAEWQCFKSGVSARRRKILTVMAATFPDNIREVIFQFIMMDVKNRIELAFSWLYEEYCLLQGFTRHSYIKTEHKPDHAYNKLFNQLVISISEKKEIKEKIILFRRLFLEAPLLPEESLSCLMASCELEDMSFHCLELVKDLAVRRPARRNRFIDLLLAYSVHENAMIREKALENLIVLYVNHQMFISKIEEFALEFLKFLENEKPPAQLFKTEYGRFEVVPEWNEDLIKICLIVVLALLPFQPELIHPTSKVYIISSSDIKRIILRAIETPVKKIGPHSQEILQLIEDCPKGVETLVTRIVHTLTEKTKPTPELVSRVRQLYQTKVNDVRILIPILSGLTKTEVLIALPKFLKLNPIVVKEVFNRLLRIGPEFAAQTMPISPAEVLVALHTIDLSKCELKCIVKATSICLAEKEVYTQDTLASCLQQLVEITPLPTILMRTIIQSLTLYNRLAPFVLKLLQRLIIKQVWKHKVIWDGFLKCCQRLKPDSFTVLLQLPLAQLQDAILQCPDLRKPLTEYAESINAGQGEPVSAQMLDILAGNTQDVFVTDESLGYIRLENIKKEKEEYSEVPPSNRSQPLPPGED